MSAENSHTFVYVTIHFINVTFRAKRFYNPSVDVEVNMDKHYFKQI